MIRKLTPVAALAALLAFASPPLLARGNGSGTSGSSGSDMSAPSDRATDNSGSHPSTDRDVYRTYDQMGDDSLSKDRKTRRSKDRNPNAAVPATPATPADPSTGTPASPATPAMPSNRDTTQ